MEREIKVYPLKNSIKSDENIRLVVEKGTDVNYSTLKVVGDKGFLGMLEPRIEGLLLEKYDEKSGYIVENVKKENDYYIIVLKAL